MQSCWAEETYFKTLDNITDPNLNTIAECYNTCINTAVVGVIIYIIIIVLLFYFILQNKSKITILTFMNVDGAFILAEICRNQEVLLFVDHSMQIFIRYISLRIWEDVYHTYHMPLKNDKNEQMMSKCFSAEFPRALNPGAASSCSAVWIHAIRACFRKHNNL